MRRCFHLVLRGHNRLATAPVFRRGRRAASLEQLARQFLWKAGLDY